VSSDPLYLGRECLGETRSNRVQELVDVDGLAERAGQGGQLVHDALQLGDVTGAPVVNL
jgi:hypothetical protein